MKEPVALRIPRSLRMGGRSGRYRFAQQSPSCWNATESRHATGHTRLQTALPHAEEMDFPKAEALIRKCRDSSLLLATREVSALVAQLAKKGHTVTAAAVIAGSGRVLPDLAANPSVPRAPSYSGRRILPPGADRRKRALLIARQKSQGARRVGKRRSDLSRLS